MKKVALVTGGAQRIGLRIVERLAAEGYAVAIHCRRSADEAERSADRIRRSGGEAAVVQGDLADAAAVERLVPEAVRALGPLTLLVNNASEFEPDEVETLTQERWDRHFAVNLRAPAFLARDFAHQLPAEGQGCIVNIVDQRVWKPTPNFFSYAASKMALWSVTRTLAQALAPRIRVNAIGPGPVLKSAHQTDEEFRRQCEATILGRGTTPDEIAQAIQFILSAPAMTGQMVALDGGQHLAWDTPDVRRAPRG
jgi:NAD(P)-dependent dehydrogenase (short-subunit alcohol dehydrogenase family)